MERRSPWVTRGAVYVLVVALLSLSGALDPGLLWLSMAAWVLSLPAGAVVTPLVVALTIGLASLVPGVSDPGSIHPALMAVPASVAAAALNVLLVRTLVRVLAPRWAAPREGRPEPQLATSGPHPTGSSAVPQGVAWAPAQDRPAAGSGVLAVVTVVAFLAQGLVALGTFLMGLGWGGPTYYAALLQALAGLGLIGWLVSRRRRIAALVPLVSAALTALLAVAGQSHAAATACSPQERALAQELAAPPGVDAELIGNMEGCFMSFETGLSLTEVREHYEAEFSKHGWEPVNDMDGTPAATKDGTRLTVFGDPVPEGGLYVVVELNEAPAAD